MLGIEKFPTNISLAVTVGLIASGILYSIYKTNTIQKS